jgi:hypothetical protein
LEDFPCEAGEWARVKEITLGIVNATLADDDVLARAGFLELEECSNALISKYGSHPVLLETLADFAPDPEMQLELYRKASEESLTRKRPIHTIHVCWGRILIEECRRPEEALRILEACSRDVEVLADEDEKAEYCRLLGAARRSARLS